MQRRQLVLSSAGGPIFNFAGFCKTEEETKVMRTKELQNGRLAMLSCFAYGAQAVITGKGPIDNLFDHLGNPTGANLLTNFGHIGGN
jgi:light-harvesting complex I chlorophyll a/b binding protein 3